MQDAVTHASPVPTVDLVTLAVTDAAASLAFYRDRLGYVAAAQGTLDSLPPALGSPDAGRPFAVLRPPPGVEGVALRLIQTPPHAPRPAPTLGASTANGFTGLSLVTGDDGDAYMALKSAQATLLSWPQYYTLPAETEIPRREFKTFTVLGPDGELIFIDRQLSQGGVMTSWTEAARYARGAVVLVTRDRWPLFAFYGALAGAAPDKGRHMQQDPMNVAIGAPPGSYFHFGRLAGGLYWREFRSEPPLPAKPLSLDAPGLAMITFAVDDIDAARDAGVAAGGRDLHSGSLPDEDGAVRPGAYLQAPGGERVEIVARKATS